MIYPKIKLKKKNIANQYLKKDILNSTLNQINNFIRLDYLLLFLIKLFHF